MLRRLLSVAALGILVGCSERSQGPELRLERVLLILPEDADVESDSRIREADAYLERVTGVRPRVELTSDWSKARALARKSGAPLVLVFDGARILSERYDAARLDALGDSGFVLDGFEDGTWEALDGEEGSVFLVMEGNTTLARQYALYEALRRLGVRYFHPEHEYVPERSLGDLRPLALRPTAVHRSGADYTPDYAARAWSFHSSHPLEHLESFSDGDAPIDEARNVNRWIVKNRGNRFRGLGRGVPKGDARDRRAQELEAMRVGMGFPRGARITLHNEQQGADAEIDPSRPEPVRAQIEALVTEKLAEVPDAQWFNIHFGPTEFTTTPDVETVQWIDWAGTKALELRPDIEVLVNVHITGQQPMPNYGDLGCPSGTNDDNAIDYYDLAFHTDERLGASVHTVMFYPLEGPARVYNQQTFAHKLCLMEQASAQGRPLQWFPEGSWWLSFDNSVPVYLPVYVWARHRDFELTAPLLESRGGGTLRSHRMFNSGHEWGYWQQDYAVGLWAWNVDIPLDAVLEEMFDPLCAPDAWRGCDARAEAVDIMQELMLHQREFFLEREDWQGRPGGLYSYFAGEDQGDEIAAASGLEFRPVKVPVTAVLGWSDEEAARFEGSDLSALEDAASLNHAWADRLEALDVAAAGQPWLDEVVDGVRINALRAEHTAALYRAVLARRVDDPRAPQLLAMGEATLVAAEAVVRRRESAYRYPAEQVYGGGLTPQTAVPNGTTYGYRVHTKTHLLTYWHNRQDRAAALVVGSMGAAAVQVEDAVDTIGAPLELAWADGDVAGTISIGEVEVSAGEASAMLDGAGVFAVEGELVAGGVVVPVLGDVVRSDTLAETPVGSLVLQEPSAPLAQTALTHVVPAIRWAWLPGSLALGYDLDGNGAVTHEHVQEAAASMQDDGRFLSEPIQLSIPVQRSGGTLLQIRVDEATFSGRVSGGSFAEDINVVGRIRVDDLVEAMIEIGGFDEVGALATLSQLLDFDPSAPPVAVPIQGQFGVQPRAE